jgi:hypothetical protein
MMSSKAIEQTTFVMGGPVLGPYGLTAGRRQKMRLFTPQEVPKDFLALNLTDCQQKLRKCKRVLVP